MTVKFPDNGFRAAMVDSVNAAALPDSTTKAAGYVNGAEPSLAAIVKRFPRAKAHGIDVLGTGWRDASILDYEEGNPAYKNPQLVRDFITERNTFAPDTACIYCPETDLDEVEDYAEGLWHVNWVAHWGGRSLTGARTWRGNLIVATQLVHLAGYDVSDSLESW